VLSFLVVMSSPSISSGHPYFSRKIFFNCNTCTDIYNNFVI